MKFIFKRNQILPFFFSKSGITDVDPMSGNDPFDWVAVKDTMAGSIDKAGYCIRCSLRSEFNDDARLVCHIYRSSRIHKFISFFVNFMGLRIFVPDINIIKCEGK